MNFVFSLLFLVVSIWAKQPFDEIKKNDGGRIVGGQVARTGQFPSTAAIDVQTSDSKFFCGGALISNQWLLTAAHCIYQATLLTVRLGSNSLTIDDPNRETVATSEIVPHPDFNPDTLENDIGLVKLRLPIKYSDYIQPINLASVNLPNTTQTIALGWGQISDEDPELTTELNYVTVTVISNAECQLTYGNQITDNMVCVGGNYNEGACVGDSGSPLVVSLIGGLFLQHVGVSSFISGNGCESTDPSGYTRTYPYVPWINSIIAAS